MESYHGTTILGVRRKTPKACRWRSVAMGRLRWATLWSRAVPAKSASSTTAKGAGGFPGATADAFTLFERFEAKLEKHQGHLTRAAVELTKDWRTDRVLRRLEAMLAVADLEHSLIITGNGDVLEPEHGIVAIGSGPMPRLRPGLVAPTALSAAGLSKSLEIAGELCIYTNMQHTLETIGDGP